jgi:hypothetical protein
VSRGGWIGVDLDGTLAYYEPGQAYRPDHVGEPIPAMLERVQRWLAEGRDVRIMTARVWSDGTPERNAQERLARLAIVTWCRKHFNTALAVTCQKDMGMAELWDDRARQVELNTGRLLGQE